MKKMRNSKRGFTLTEILIVVAIVVFLSAAAFVGVAVTLNNARETNAKLQLENGDNFEVEARQAVKDITANAAEFFDIPYYTPENNSGEETEETEDPESTGETETPGGGGGDTHENSPTPTTKATETPTPTPEPTATTAPSGGGSKPSNISNLPGTVSSGKTNTVSCSVGDARDWGQDSRRVSVKGESPIYSIKLKFEGGSPSLDDANWMYDIKSLGNGVFELTYKANDASNKPIKNFEFNYRSDKGTSTGNVVIQSIQYYNE